MSREACNKKKNTLRSLPVHAIQPMLFELHAHHYLFTEILCVGFQNHMRTAKEGSLVSSAPKWDGDAPR